MKEELQKEVISAVKEEVAEIKSSLSERIKLPILIAYCIILAVYNWDVLFYIFFESGIPSEKIAYINKNFTNEYHNRFLVPLMLSCLSTFAFPVLQVGINVLFREFKNENDKLIREKEKANVEHEKSLTDIKSSNKERDSLQGELNNKKSEILVLKSQITHLERNNLDLVQSEKETSDLLKDEQQYIKILLKQVESIKEIFHIYSNKNYVSDNINYQAYFNKFYDYYLSKQTKEQKFIQKLFNKLYKSSIIEDSEIEKIDISELVNVDIMIDNLIRLEILKNHTQHLELTNKGKEVVSLFRTLNI